MLTRPDSRKEKKKKMLYCHAASTSEQYAPVANILEPMYWHEVEKWKDTTIGKRGKEYNELKQKRAEALIDYIDQRHPGLKNSIKNYYTTTPLTYRDYTATKEGSAYGIIKDFNKPYRTLLPTKTKISNLFFTGQNNNVHGMLGVILTAMYTCSEFIDVNYLAKKIGNV